MKSRIHLGLDCTVLDFGGEDKKLEDKEGRECTPTIDNQHQKTLIEQSQNQSIRELTQAMGVSISTISDHLKKISKVRKLNKWVPHEVNKVKELNVLKCV